MNNLGAKGPAHLHSWKSTYNLQSAHRIPDSSLYAVPHPWIQPAWIMY